MLNISIELTPKEIVASLYRDSWHPFDSTGSAKAEFLKTMFTFNEQVFLEAASLLKDEDAVKEAYNLWRQELDKYFEVSKIL